MVDETHGLTNWRTQEPMYLVRPYFMASGGQAGLQGVAMIYGLACV